jgi:hypothetical protein
VPVASASCEFGAQADSLESSLTLACCITITLLAPPALLILSSQVSSPVSIITLQGSQYPAQPQHRVCNSPNRGNQRQRGFIISLPGRLTHAPTTHTLPLAAASRTSDTQKPRKTQKGCSEFSGRLLAGHDIALTFSKHYLTSAPRTFQLSWHPIVISRLDTHTLFGHLKDKYRIRFLFTSPICLPVPESGISHEHSTPTPLTHIQQHTCTRCCLCNEHRPQ